MVYRSCARNQPSTLAPVIVADAPAGTARNSAGDIARKAAMESLPAALAKAAPAASASASVVIRPNDVCDSAMALCASPFNKGDPARKLTLRQPPDSPQMVIAFGSPPNWAILFFTQRIAAN